MTKKTYQSEFNLGMATAPDQQSSVPMISFLLDAVTFFEKNSERFRKSKTGDIDQAQIIAATLYGASLQMRRVVTVVSEMLDALRDANEADSNGNEIDIGQIRFALANAIQPV